MTTSEQILFQLVLADLMDNGLLSNEEAQAARLEFSNSEPIFVKDPETPNVAA